MYIYCVYCATQRCDRIAEVMEACGVRRAFSPKIVRHQRRRGQNETVYYDLLPGYVFMYSDQEILGLTEYRWIDGIIREAGRAEDRYDLTGEDRRFAEQLYEKDGLVGAMSLVRRGEQVSLSDPLFQGSRGVITRIDYRKQRVRVDFSFNNTACHTWVAIDSVKEEKQ